VRCGERGPHGTARNSSPKGDCKGQPATKKTVVGASALAAAHFPRRRPSRDRRGYGPRRSPVGRRIVPQPCYQGGLDLVVPETPAGCYEIWTDAAQGDPRQCTRRAHRAEEKLNLWWACAAEKGPIWFAGSRTSTHGGCCDADPGPSARDAESLLQWGNPATTASEATATSMIKPPASEGGSTELSSCLWIGLSIRTRKLARCCGRTRRRSWDPHLALALPHGNDRPNPGRGIRNLTAGDCEAGPHGVATGSERSPGHQPGHGKRIRPMAGRRLVRRREYLRRGIQASIAPRLAGGLSALARELSRGFVDGTDAPAKAPALRNSKAERAPRPRQPPGSHNQITTALAPIR